ncbi:hypothetical protein VPH35_019081 [Triticum aestivum]
MTTTTSVSPSLSLSPLHSERAFPFPRSSARSRAGVAFPARSYGPLLHRRTPAMSAGGVGVNGSPVAPEDYAAYMLVGHFFPPCIQDLSGRPHLSCGLSIPKAQVGTYDTQLVEHFFQSLENTSGMTLHIRQLAGNNSHHIIEACFKAFARALRQATECDFSKGVLSRS